MNAAWAVVSISLIWVIGTYAYYYFWGNRVSLIPGMGSHRSDEDVIVPQKKFVVNVVFEQGQVVSQDLLADLVVNVNDLMKGIYKVPDLLSNSAPSTIVASDPKEILEEDPENEEEEDLIIYSDPEEIPNTIEESEIPDPTDMLLIDEVLDLKKLNLDI